MREAFSLPSLPMNDLFNRSIESETSAAFAERKGGKRVTDNLASGCGADASPRRFSRRSIVERDARHLLGGADGERGLDAGDVGRGRELAGEEFLEALQVAADDL